MLVTMDNINEVIDDLRGYRLLGLDTETTGLGWKDRIFSIIIARPRQAYYFNFNGCKDLEGNKPDTILPRREVLDRLQILFADPEKMWAAHNAKFDLEMLAKDGVEIAGQIHCTKSAARILKNSFMIYSLDDVAWRELGARKDDGVKAYIQKSHLLTDAEKKHNNKCKNPKDRIKKPKCYKMVQYPGKKTKTKVPFFYKVPMRIIVPYGLRDAELTLKLAERQLQELYQRPIWTIEKHMPKIVGKMEQHGISIDVEYCQAALQHEYKMLKQAKQEFCDIAGLDKYVAGPIVLTKIFERFKLPIQRTEKGNPTFKDDVLEKIDHPIVSKILQIREHEKRAGTYYETFLFKRDNDNLLHCSLNFDGTVTGRFSSSGPNLQNVPKQEEDGLEYYVRKCFQPNEDEVFLMIDYDQQEFRMMLDYAGQHDLIQEILNGADVHQATADMIGITRKQAKTINYGLIYGMGVAKLARQLDMEVEEARALRRTYFDRLPDIQLFIRTCMQVAEQKGFVRSWAGRYFFLPDRDFAYKAPNQIIQGGCGDVIKKAMVEIDSFLKPYKTHMKLQIHDELLFGLHKSELHLAPELKHIMEEAYPPMNRMKLTCSASWSPISWGHCDKIEGLPPHSKSQLKRLDIMSRSA